MATNTNTNNVKTVEVKAKALKDEFGRRRKNKARKAAGEKVVRTKAYYLGNLSAEERTALEAGEVVTKTYKSGRTENYVLAK